MATHPVTRMVDHVMGIPISLALRGPSAGTAAAQDAFARVMSELRQVDEVFSTYRPDSMINRLGRGEIKLADCPADVLEVFALAEEAEEDSSGAFSIWLTGADGTTRLDPSGVVKGWAVERVSRHLTSLSRTDFCLSAGGDMVCWVSEPGRPKWRVGIEDPQDPRRLISTISIGGGAVATSAATHRGDHIVDARTGMPPSDVASVTVIGRSLTVVDICATAAYAHGPHAANWLKRRRDVTGLVVWADGTTTAIPCGRSEVGA
ncbi:FAD:protein FMN transferase [Microlunatus sp. Gsoil 973]|uniref:FAD:protein FMN transferase n=1 Tax=Microlunatus sp. Gsoil 973 TaxID=2672569 RepID=UPI001E5F8081|nr:FAD:protein FMN transferase [Microlunatus sp. Gsoil 973]